MARRKSAAKRSNNNPNATFDDKSNQGLNRTQIAVAIISALAIIIAALIGMYATRVQVELPIKETQTAKAEANSKKGSFFSQELHANQVMFVTSGQLQYNDLYCGGSLDLICVLIYQATYPQTVTVQTLDPEHYAFQLRDNLSAQEMLEAEMSGFWQPPNCMSGCLRATYFIMRDGQLVHQETIEKP